MNLQSLRTAHWSHADSLGALIERGLARLARVGGASVPASRRRVHLVGRPHKTYRVQVRKSQIELLP